MNARNWEEREARLDLAEQRIDNYARFVPPSDREIDAELERRANERGISVAELIDMNRKEFT